jgi:hypothetical protein
MYQQVVVKYIETYYPNRDRKMKYYILSIIMSPILILISVFTQGSILPTLTDHKTWTIEYIPIVLVSIFGVFLAFKGYEKIKKKNWFYPICAFNLIIGLFYVYSTIILWGDKY